MMRVHPSSEDSSPKEAEHVLELLHEFDAAMLVTRSSIDDGLRARPMALAEVDGDGSVWLVTDVTSPKVGELATNPEVLLTFQDGRRYLALRGDAAVVRSPEKVRELWKETFKLWFDGPDDPRLVLLEITPRDAEYWDTSGSRGLKFAFRAAKAYLAGEPAKKEDDPAVHGRIRG
jgi:general stress protein 26